MRTTVKLLFLYALFAVPCGAQELATLYSKEGNVSIRSAGATTWHAAVLGQKLKARDVIRTDGHARAALTLTNGVLVRVNENTWFELKDEHTGGAAIESGAAHFFSRKAQELPTVDTPMVSASVVGTEFVVAVNKEFAEISVLNGKVTAKNKHGSANLTSGEKVVAKLNQGPEKAILVKPLEAVQWALYYPTVLDPAEFAELKKLSAGKEAGSVVERASNALAAGQIQEMYSEVGKIDSLLKDIPDARNSFLSVTSSLKAAAALVMNDRQAALKFIEDAHRLNPDSASAALVHSYISQSLFDLDGARNWVEKALQSSPDNGFAHTRLAELALAFGDVQSAYASVNNANQLHSEDPYTLATLGFVHLTRFEADKALEVFKRAAALGGASGLPYFGLGLAMIRQGDLTEGRKEIQKAAHLEPSVALYRSYLGKAFFEEEEEDLAGEEYERAIELDESDPTPYLYRAFQRLSTHRPLEALADIEQSITLNGNRALYRSRLMLDQDLSVRSAGLAQIFNAVGFGEAGRIEAIKSLNRDYSNHSAHLFLSQTYEDVDRFLNASISEYFIARLLSPVNFNLIQPSTSSAASFNEYTALFDRPVHRQQLSLSGRTKDKFVSGEVTDAQSFGDFGYTLSYLGAYGDGFRDNDTSEEHTIEASGQYQAGASDTILIDGNATFFDDGDTELDFDPESNDPDYTFKLDDYFVRVGFNHRINARGNIIGQLLYNNSSIDLRDLSSQRPLFITTFLGEEEFESTAVLVDLDQEIDLRSRGTRFDMQYIQDTEIFSLVFGGGILRSELEQDETGIPYPSDSVLDTIVFSTMAENDEESERGFLYTTLHAGELMDIHAGANYTHLTLSGSPVLVPYVEADDTLTRWNPKAGISVYPAERLTLRAAYFETVGSSGIREFEVIEPTIFGGFNQVFYDLLPGTRARNRAVGIDWKPLSGTYTGVEGIHRNITQDQLNTFSALYLDAESFEILGEDIVTLPETSRAEEDIVRAYAYQVLSKHTTGTLDLTWSSNESESLETNADTIHAKFGINHFLDNGFFVFGAANWREQELEGYSDIYGEGADDTRDFWIVDAGAGYQFPKRHGQVRLVLENIFDQDFHYLPTGLEADILPGIGGKIEFTGNF